MSVQPLTRVALSSLIGLSSMFGGARAPVQGADALVSDIPGVPILSGAVIRGEIGGSVVDLVYSIQVPAASVLVATVRGEPESELGLYLFGTPSASILTAVPLASSAKPGGIQSISVRFIRESTVYLNLNGRNEDRAYAFTFQATILTDVTPPTISSVIAAASTRSDSLCVQVRSVDPISGVTAAALWDPLGAEPTWVPFYGVGRVCTTVDPGDGRRRLSLRVRNGVDLVSPLRVLTMTIDDTPPAIVGALPLGDTMLSPRAAIAWRFNEMIAAVGPLREVVAVFNQEGRRIPGSVVRSQNRRRIIWRPTTNIPPGSVLMASLGGVRDLASNVLAFLDTRVITRKRTTSLFISVSASGSKAILRITGSSALGSEIITLQVKSSRGWSDAGHVALTNGSAARTFRAARGSIYRVLFQGSDTLAPSASNNITIP